MARHNMPVMTQKNRFLPHSQIGSCIRDPSTSAARPGRGAVREEGSHPPFFGDGVDGGFAKETDLMQMRGKSGEA